MTHDPTFWLLARASGLTAYVLLTLSVLAGLTVKSRPFGRALKAASATDTHKFLSWLALGVVAAQLAGLVVLSFPLRKRIGVRTWRRLHFATFAIFALATAHGLAAGSDSSQRWV